MRPQPKKKTTKKVMPAKLATQKRACKKAKKPCPSKKKSASGGRKRAATSAKRRPFPAPVIAPFPPPPLKQPIYSVGDRLFNINEGHLYCVKVLKFGRNQLTGDIGYQLHYSGLGRSWNGWQAECDLMPFTEELARQADEETKKARAKRRRTVGGGGGSGGRRRRKRSWAKGMISVKSKKAAKTAKKNEEEKGVEEGESGADPEVPALISAEVATASSAST